MQLTIEFAVIISKPLVPVVPQVCSNIFSRRENSYFFTYTNLLTQIFTPHLLQICSKFDTNIRQGSWNIKSKPISFISRDAKRLSKILIILTIFKNVL